MSDDVRVDIVQRPQTSAIGVSSNISAGWRLTTAPLDGGAGQVFNGTGTSGSYTVTPGSFGTVYSIEPSVVSGYSSSVNNSVTSSGSSFTLFGGGQTVSFTITYSPIVPPQPFNYSLSSSGMTRVTKQSVDAYGQNTITKTLTSGTPENVDITLTNVPAGVSYNVSNQGCSPTCQSTITFTVSPSAANGTYQITATGNPLGRQTSFNLVIEGSALSATCTPSPAVALVGEPITWTANVSGGTAPYTYSWSGNGIPTNPAPSTNPYVVTYSTVGQKTASVVVNDNKNNEGVCTAGSIQIKFNPKFREI